MYTVKQLSDLAGVSVRTLHYYDEIGLLKPSSVGANGYRRYDEAAVLRLQQILFYRELGLELLQIRDVLDAPGFDLVAALRDHRRALRGKIGRLQALVDTVDSTIQHLTGEKDVSKKQLFKGFSKKQQKQYEREARLQYGPDNVNESVRRWASYSKAEQKAIQEQGGQVYLDFVAALKAGKAADDPDVQAIVRRWHHNIRYFYEPTPEILRGLPELYNTHPDFIAFFEKIDPRLTAYIAEAVPVYVDALETEAIEQMLAEDERTNRG